MQQTSLLLITVRKIKFSGISTGLSEAEQFWRLRTAGNSTKHWFELTGCITQLSSPLTLQKDDLFANTPKLKQLDISRTKCEDMPPSFARAFSCQLDSNSTLLSMIYLHACTLHARTDTHAVDDQREDSSSKHRQFDALVRFVLVLVLRVCFVL